MPSREETFYYGAGPAPLPTNVLETAAKALLNYKDGGVGIAEISHRSELAGNVLNEAKADLKNYLDIPDDYDVLFMQGGGTGQFSASLYNLVGVWVTRKKAQIATQLSKSEDDAAVVEGLKTAIEKELKVDYLITGSWSKKAHEEATRLLGPENVNVVADGRKINDGKFGKIPEESIWNLSKGAAMVYYCDNETVDGNFTPNLTFELTPNLTPRRRVPGFPQGPYP
jgi:phosphoserine aminotransferase